MLKMISVLFFFLCFAISSSNHGVDEMNTTFREDLDLERQLKLMNKLPAKSIQTKFGYIVDCIDINKQPAFDHPLLKNHKLQRKPNLQQTKAKASVNSSIAKPIVIGLEKVSCPAGTVPIRRTTKNDLIQAKSLLNAQIDSVQNPGIHVAEVSLSDYYLYHGVSGTGSVYNPQVDKDQSSAGYVWVQNGQTDYTDKIVAGWHVHPQLYGDYRTHLYSLWTADDFQKTGCYNTICTGFVQVDDEIYIGAPVANTSIYGGTMFELPISLTKDPNTNDWWLKMVNKNVGYFPAALFSNMTEAMQVGWGGKTTNPLGGPSPPMGSGSFPDGNFLHASYFRHVAIRDSDHDDEWGPQKGIVNTFTDNSDCFDAEYYGDQGGDFGFSLQFGGPGGKCDDD